MEERGRRDGGGVREGAREDWPPEISRKEKY